MKLVDLCEPLFQKICYLNRLGRTGHTYDLDRARGEILTAFDEIRARAAGEPGLAENYERMELPLIFFVDYMIKESDLPFAREWVELAMDRNELAGDEKFFILLDDALADPSEPASQRLEVFYSCMGLGFAGIYAGQPAYVRQKMTACLARMRGAVDAGNGRICPEAYEYTDQRDFVEPPSGKLLGIAIAVVGMLIVVFGGNVWLYRTHSGELGEALTKIIATADGSQTADAPNLASLETAEAAPRSTVEGESLEGEAQP